MLNILSKANKNRKVIFDKDLNQIILLDDLERIMGCLQMKSTENGNARIKMAVTRFSFMGDGWLLYLTALALVSKEKGMLSADSDSVSGTSTLIWEKIWACESISRKTLPLEQHNFEYQDEYFEELPLTNPNTSSADFEIYSKYDHKRFYELFEKGTLNPHLYNFGFSISDDMTKHMLKKVELASLTRKQKQDSEHLWEDRFMERNIN